MAKSKSKKAVHPNWRPNFRNPETLPDIKVVRTGFLLNFIAGALLAGAIVYVAYFEYRMNNLGANVEAVSAEIEENEAQNRAAVALSQQFQKKAQRLMDVAEFEQTPMEPYRLVERVVNVLPEQAVLDSFRVDGEVLPGKQKQFVYSLALSGVVYGTPEAPAPQVITTMVRELKKLQAVEEDESESTIDFRPVAEGSDDFNFRVALQIKPEEAKG